MPTLKQVEAHIALQHPDSGVVLFGARGGEFNPLGGRPHRKGGGAVLVVYDFDPEDFGVAPSTAVPA